MLQNWRGLDLKRCFSFIFWIGIRRWIKFLFICTLLLLLLIRRLMSRLSEWWFKWWYKIVICYFFTIIITRFYANSALSDLLFNRFIIVISIAWDKSIAKVIFAERNPFLLWSIAITLIISLIIVCIFWS